MTKTVAIIGAGQIGYAAANAFYGRGWNISIHSRTRPSWPQFPKEWRSYVAGEDSPPEADAIIDTIAFDEEDVERYDPDKIGRLIVISSASVYCDDRGRTLDEAAQNGFPEFDGPITEQQSTVAPGPGTYSTRKVRMENTAGERFGDRATILRPCAIYGPHSRHPREWWFVKRLLDGRERIPLARMGRSQFQTTDVEQIADFAALAADQDVGGVFNIADTDAPSVLEIGQAISAAMAVETELVPVEDAGEIGRTPWSVPRPFVVDRAKAAAFEDDQPFPYADHVHPAVRWLCDLNPADWRTAFPQLAAYPWDLFDYEAEDDYFASLG